MVPNIPCEGACSLSCLCSIHHDLPIRIYPYTPCNVHPASVIPFQPKVDMDNLADSDLPHITNSTVQWVGGGHRLGARIHLGTRVQIAGCIVVCRSVCSAAPYPGWYLHPGTTISCVFPCIAHGPWLKVTPTSSSRSSPDKETASLLYFWDPLPWRWRELSRGRRGDFGRASGLGQITLSGAC